MQDEEQERRKILADLEGMPLDEVVDLIGDMTVRDALRMRLVTYVDKGLGASILKAVAPAEGRRIGQPGRGTEDHAPESSPAGGADSDS